MRPDGDGHTAVANGTGSSTSNGQSNGLAAPPTVTVSTPPNFPPCGAAFLRHLHTDPKSKHVNLPTAAGRPKTMSVPFHQQRSPVATPSEQTQQPPTSIDFGSLPPPTALPSQSLPTTPPLHNIGPASPTSPKSPVLSAPLPAGGPSRSRRRPGTAPVARPTRDGDGRLTSSVSQENLPLATSHLRDQDIAASTPPGAGAARSRVASERPAQPPVQQLTWSEFARAYQHGRWDPIRMPTAPISDSDPSPSTPASATTVSGNPHYSSHSVPTPPGITRQHSLPGRTKDSGNSAAAHRLAASTSPPSMFEPLNLTSPDHEKMDPYGNMRLSEPSSSGSAQSASSEPVTSGFDRIPMNRHSSSIGGGAGVPDLLPTIQASPAGTPNDASGMPPILNRPVPSHKIPPATAPLPQMANSANSIAEPQGDYFGDAVVATEPAVVTVPEEDEDAGSPPSVAESNDPFTHPEPRYWYQVEPFFKRFGYLAAPPPPNEAERLKALYSYNMMHTPNDVNFDRIAHMIKLVFKVKIGLITLMDNDCAWFKARTGFSFCQTPRCASLCSHTILSNSDEPMIVLDTMRDWRFRNNPVVTNAPNVRFYAGAPLRTPNGLNVGSLCLIDDQPRSEFPPRSRHILKEFAAIVMREMELFRDRLQLRTRDKIQTSMENFTRECLEIDDQLSTNATAANKLNQVYTRAAKLITTTLELDGCAILDISQFERVEITAPTGERHYIYHANPYAEGESHMVEQTDVFGAVGAFPVLATAPVAPCPTRPLTPVEHEKMSAFLSGHRDGRIFEGVAPSWIKYIFPSTLKYGMVVPVIGIDKQPFALICAYTHDKGKQFLEGYELQFLRAIGVIILSAVLRRRMLMADRSKSVLISSVSHELRTPLHGILAASELLGDSNLDGTQEALLSTVRTCGLQLIETVNHVLDFTKLSGSARNKTQSLIQLTKTNLAELIQQTVESCWLGARGRLLQQGENQVGSFYAPVINGLLPHDQRAHVQDALAHVETVLDIGPREKGWNVMCESGGLRRILMNLYGNSLKFTEDGYIQVVLRELPHAPDAKRIPVQLAVIDTGHGIGKGFLKEQLFQPFSQENPLLPGTGLGLAIVNSIACSEAIKGNVEVWSIEGEGTEIRITFEVEVAEEVESPYIDRSIGIGYSVGFVNFATGHRGLQLSMEVMGRYAEFMGFTIAEDYRKADVLIMHELHGLTDDNLELVKSRPTILIATFKIWARDRLHELGMIKSQYIRILCKPMVRFTLIYELWRAGTYLRRGDGGDGSELGELPSSLSDLALDSPATRPKPNCYSGPQEPQVSSFEPQVKRAATPLLRRRSEEAAKDELVSQPRPNMGPRGVTYHPGQVKPASNELAPSISQLSPVTSPNSTISLADGGAMLRTATLSDGPMSLSDSELPSSPARIMVVEDNVINRRLLTTFLKKRGFEYSEAVNGAEGVKLFETTPPNTWDVVLMDITMPIMNGYDATRAIRGIEVARRHGTPSETSSGSSTDTVASLPSDQRHTKIFALTGLATPDDKRQAFGSGVDGYLVKPVSLTSLDSLFKKIGF